LKDEYNTVEAAEKICGVRREDIIKAAKVLTNEGRAPRPKCTFANEKGLYWSNNYLGTVALVNVAMLCGSGNRPGAMCVRGGGHQRGMVRGAGYPFMKSPERSARMGRINMQQDKWTLAGRTKFMWVEATQWIESMMGSQDLAAYIKAHTIDAPQQVESTDESDVIQTLIERADAGNLVVVHSDPYLRTLGALYADFVLPAAQWGEENFARNNGERVLKIYEKITDPPGQSKPDWWMHMEVAKKMGFDGWNWNTSEDVFKEAARFTRNGSQDYAPLIIHAAMIKRSPYDLLRERGATGYQTPLLLVDGKLVETKRLHDSTRINEFIRTPGISTLHKNFTHFTSTTGKGLLRMTDWRLYKDYHDLVAPRKEKGELWITNGRVNEIWQSLYDDLRVPVITQRYPMHFVEIHPDDAKPRGIETGDLVSIENDLVWVQVAGWYAPDDNDMLASTLLKKGYLRPTKGAVTAMAIVYDPDAVLVKSGVAFQYFMWPGAPSQAVSANISDPLSNAPRYKLGRGRIRKIGVTQFKGTISMAPKDLVPARRRRT
jgi:arsenite oxidase large subunit